MKNLVDTSLTFCNIGFSQKFTLQQCINYALKNNLGIKSSELNIKSAKLNLLKTKMNLLPTLNFNSNETFMIGRTIDPLTNEFAESNVTTTSFSLISSINIFSGFQNLNTIKQNYYIVKSSEFEYKKIKNNISITITSLYLQVLLATELYNSAKKQKKILALEVEKNKKLLDANVINRSTHLEAVSQYNNEHLQLVSSENTLKISQLALIQAMELDTLDTIEILINIDIDTSYLNKSINDIILYTINDHPYLKSYYFKLLAADKAIDISRSGRHSKLYITGSYATGYSSQRKNIVNIIPSQPLLTSFSYDNNGNLLEVYSFTYKYDYETIKFKNQLKDNLSRSFSINLTIPIFNNWQVNNNIKLAQINYKISHYNYKRTKKQVIKDVQQVYYEYILAYNKYKASAAAYKATSEAYYLAEERYNSGLIYIYEYNLSNLFRLKPELSKSKHELIFKQEIPDFYCDKQIKL
ncbi:MAG: TolC family protein [Bacteroidales bacterium]|nr:TolC family protein [Bacteroidales bacterium]